MSSLCSTVPKLSKSFAEKAVVDERSVGLEREVYLSLSHNTALFVALTVAGTCLQRSTFLLTFLDFQRKVVLLAR